MTSTQCEVLVVGAGAAGLSALHELRSKGVNAVCLEARNRIGGRAFTLHDPNCAIPIELGPEFIHGRPPEIWRLVQDGHLAAYDCEENAVRIRKGQPTAQENSWDQMARVTRDMKEVAKRGEDPTFASFVSSQSYSKELQEAATSFVEGFNAAHKEIVGVASLAADATASEAIDGGYNFRILNGYDAVMRQLAAPYTDEVKLGHAVEQIAWRRGEVRATVRLAESGERFEAQAAGVVITLPLGVLQAGDVEFLPTPHESLAAANALRFGQVNRVMLRFRESWWERIEHLKDAGFWLSDERFFPTWWTSLPVRAPLLVGWSSGSRADLLATAQREEILESCLSDLTRAANVERGLIDDQLEASYFQDWRNDPFARGAYSYVPAGAMRAREILASPVEETLFFSGEATELDGHSATVHGAIASGRRAARQFLAATTNRNAHQVE